MDLSRYKNVAVTGTRLAEFLSVSVNPHANKECQLHGSIQVYDCEGTVSVFDVGPENSQTISNSNKSLLLSISDRAIFARSEFTVLFDLKEKHGDAEFVRGSFSWKGSRYNMQLVENIEGKLGYVTVYYIVHWVALEANIGAKFVIGEGIKTDLNVSGKLVAQYKNRCGYNDKDMEGHCEFTIFEGMVPNVKNGDIFPVNRSVLALPCYTSLIIRADLWSGETVLWSDKVEFSAYDIWFKTTQEEILGAHGAVRVRVHAFNYVEYYLDSVEGVKEALEMADVFPWRFPPLLAVSEEEDVPTDTKKPKRIA